MLIIYLVFQYRYMVICMVVLACGVHGIWAEAVEVFVAVF
jgi:hypothetical protein